MLTYRSSSTFYAQFLMYFVYLFQRRLMIKIIPANSEKSCKNFANAVCICMQHCSHLSCREWCIRRIPASSDKSNIKCNKTIYSLTLVFLSFYLCLVCLSEKYKFLHCVMVVCAPFSGGTLNNGGHVCVKIVRNEFMCGS